MNFKDQWATDEEGNEFVFTIEMQRRLSEAGLPLEPAYLAQVQQEPRPVERRESGRSDERPRSRPAPAPSRPREVVGPASIQIDPQTGKYIGRIKWYNSKKGYGFLVRGAGEEIFFHKSNSMADPEQMEEGQWVLYDVEETHKGPEATDIEPYDGEIPE